MDVNGVPVEPEFPYAIGDRVWLDANRNGMQDSGETSIGAAVLTLRDASGSFLSTTTADADGFYRLTTLPGTYTVDINDPANYVSGGPLAGLLATTARTQSVVITSTNNFTIDFGLAKGPALTVDKVRAASSPATAAVGEEVTYTVTVSNMGSATAHSIMVTDTILGADLEYVSGSTSASWSNGSSTANPTTPTANKLRWDFGAGSQIATGSSLTLTYRLRVRSTATEVIITDELPGEVTYVRGSITGRGADDSNPNVLRWNIGVLPVGGEVTVTFRSTVNSGLPAGTDIRNFATVTSKEAPAKTSDDPETAEVGDPTMARTGDNDWIWLLAMLALLIAGITVLVTTWRDRLVAFAGRLAAHRRALMSALGVVLIIAAVGVGLRANVDEVAYQFGLTDTIELYEPPVAPDGAETAVAATAKKAPLRVPDLSGNRVIIPKLGIDVPIGEQEKPALARGAWHQPGSATPGAQGNMVLAGHRRRGVFSLLHRLEPGDIVVVMWEGDQHRYRVAGKTVVAPTQTSVIMREGVDRLTLYTCIPRFLGNKRTVITAYPVGE